MDARLLDRLDEALKHCPSFVRFLTLFGPPCSRPAPNGGRRDGQRTADRFHAGRGTAPGTEADAWRAPLSSHSRGQFRDQGDNVEK
jgi:hypothetical protein